MNLEQTFNGLNLANVENLISTRQEEHLTLDFKTVNGSDFTSSDDKRNFAKILSGFSNSSGGIIIWGIDARKNSAGVNCASGRKEIESLALFLSRLNEFTGIAASPIVDGVIHKIIPTSGDKGFAATLVPESNSGPHMAKFSEDRYYKRSGDSFYRMEHFDLEDMFGRRQKPKLTLQIKPASINLYREVCFVLSLTNMGKGVARSPYIAFKLPSAFHTNMLGITGNYYEGLPRVNSADRSVIAYGASPEVVIHPGTSRDICAISLSSEDHPNWPTDTLIEYEAVAEGIQLQKSTIDIPRPS